MKPKKDIHKTRLLSVKGDTVLVMEKQGWRKRCMLPGGPIKKGEDMEDSLIRKVHLDTGIALEKKNLKYSSSKTDFTDTWEVVIKHYFNYEDVIKIDSTIKSDNFVGILWLPWKSAIQYLDKEDRAAVIDYFNN